jgi:phosphoribosyl-ATP pyrophosphohydrolase
VGTEVLDEVFAVIEERRDKPKEGSYISSLLASSKAYEKVDEEVHKLVEAGRSGGKREIVHEAADLIFHTMVLLAAKGMGLAEVMEELRRGR